MHIYPFTHTCTCSRSSNYWKGVAVDEWTAGKVNMDGEVIPEAPSEDTDSSLSALDGVAQGVSSLSMHSESASGSLGGRSDSSRMSEKEIKKIAFAICQRHYAAVLPVVTRLAELEIQVGVEGQGSERRSGGHQRKSRSSK